MGLLVLVACSAVIPMQSMVQGIKSNGGKIVLPYVKKTVCCAFNDMNQSVLLDYV